MARAMVSFNSSPETPSSLATARQYFVHGSHPAANEAPNAIRCFYNIGFFSQGSGNDRLESRPVRVIRCHEKKVIRSVTIPTAQQYGANIQRDPLLTSQARILSAIKPLIAAQSVPVAIVAMLDCMLSASN